MPRTKAILNMQLLPKGEFSVQLRNRKVYFQYARLFDSSTGEWDQMSATLDLTDYSNGIAQLELNGHSEIPAEDGKTLVVHALANDLLTFQLRDTKNASSLTTEAISIRPEHLRP